MKWALLRMIRFWLSYLYLPVRLFVLVNFHETVHEFKFNEGLECFQRRLLSKLILANANPLSSSDFVLVLTGFLSDIV